MSRYNEYFDSIVPRVSDKDFAGNVISSAKKSNRSFRAVISASAAAAAIAVFTVTASAAGWDISAAVRSFFGDKSGIAEKNIVDVKITNEENTFDGLDISVKGAVREKDFAVIFLDVERTDGGVFDCAPYNIKDADGNDIIYPDGNTCEDIPVYRFEPKAVEVSYADEDGEYAFTLKNNAHCQYAVRDDSNADGHLTQAVFIDTKSSLAGAGKDDFVCDKVELELGALTGQKVNGKYSEDGKYVYASSYPVLDIYGSYSCEVELGNCTTPSRAVNCEEKASIKCYPNTNYPDELKNKRAFDFSVNSLKITPVSVSFELERDIPDETYYVERYPFLGSVIMNDGRELKFGGYDLPVIAKEGGNRVHLPDYDDQDKWTFSGEFILPEAIDVNDVKAVKIGDTEFPLG